MSLYSHSMIFCDVLQIIIISPIIRFMFFWILIIVFISIYIYNEIDVFLLQLDLNGFVKKIESWTDQDEHGVWSLQMSTAVHKHALKAGHVFNGEIAQKYHSNLGPLGPS